MDNHQIESEAQTPSQLEQQLDELITKGAVNQIIDLRLRLGQTLLDEDKAPQALTHFEKALDLSQQKNEHVLEAQLHGYCGLALKKMGNLSQALRAFLKSNKMAREVNHLPTVCDSSIQGALIYAHNNQQDKSIALLDRAWEIAEKRDYTKRKLNIASLLAEYHYDIGNVEESIHFYHLASEAAETLGDVRAQCTNLTNAGKVFLELNDFIAAKRLFKEALTKASKSGYPILEINALEGFFLVHAHQDEREDAKFYADKVIERAEAIDHPQTAMEMIHSLSAMYIKHDVYEKSLPYLERGLKIASCEDDIYYLTRYLSALGFAHYNMGHLEDAQNHYQKLLKLATEYQEQGILAFSLSRISSIYADQGKTEEALEEAQQGLAIAVKENEKHLIGELHAMLAYLHRDLHNKEKALHHCQTAIDTYQEIGEKDPLELLIELRNALSFED